jgi:hypothetical protein
MKADGIKRMLVKAIQNRARILLVGKPGLGKTALVKWAKQQTGADMITLYGSISDPTDFKGMPCIINDKPDFVPFGDLEKIFNTKKLMIVFLDDMGQGANAVQAAQMSFLDKLKGNPNVVIIAATNGRGDRANVSGLLEPVKSRFDSIINMEFDMDVFVNDFCIPEVEAGRMPIELVAFNKFRPQLMYSVKASADLVNGPCPRTVEALGKLCLMDLAEEDKYEAYAGAVGEVYAAEYLGYLPICRKLPSVDGILLNPDAANIPAASEPYAASVYFAISNALARKATDNNFDRIIKFAERLPKEFEVALVKDCLRRAPDCEHTGAYTIWGSKNSSVLM